MKKKNPDQWTHEDFQAHVEEVRASIAPSGELLRYLDRNKPDPLKRSIPFGLISAGDVKPEAEEAIRIRPWCAMRPFLLVVGSEAAAAFDLRGFQVGVGSQLGNMDPIPLETFDVAFFGENSAMSKIEWSCDAVSPGIELHFFFRNRGRVALPFRGVLWGRIE